MTNPRLAVAERVKWWADIGVVMFAALAAIAWFVSAYKPLPEIRTYWDQAPSSDPFYTALRFSAFANSVAAVFSGLSVLCMAIGTGIAIRSNKPRKL